MSYLKVDDSAQALQALPERFELCLAIGYSSGVLLQLDVSPAQFVASEHHLDDLIALYGQHESVAFHVWRRDGRWVVTMCDMAEAKLADMQTHERRQLLFGRQEVLVITDYLDYDADGQAFVAYSHPTRLERKGD
jgi:hypothetical protein